MEAQLDLIKQFILNELNTAGAGLDLYAQLELDLAGLILTENKSDAVIKSDRQLLCSIGIDLKHQVVPAAHYLKIFQAFDFGSKGLKFRDQFTNAIRKANLVYRENDCRATDDYSIMLIPLKDLGYYVDLDTLTGSEEQDFKLSQALEQKDFALRSTVFKKRDPHFGHFWISTLEELDQVMAGSQLNPVIDIVDKFGLTHFDYRQRGMQYFFYINFNGLLMETFKPNATIVDWSSDALGFLSCHEATRGRTFGISGYKKQPNSSAERTFVSITLSEPERQAARVQLLSEQVTEPFDSNWVDIIQEGVARFQI